MVKSLMVKRITHKRDVTGGLLDLGYDLSDKSCPCCGARLWERWRSVRFSEQAEEKIGEYKVVCEECEYERVSYDD